MDKKNTIPNPLAASMNLPILSAIVRHKIGLPLLVIAIGLFYGFVIAFVFRSFSNTIGLAITLVILGPFFIAILGDVKRTLWIILAVLLPVTVDVTYSHTGQASGAAGYIISLFDLILAALYMLWFVELACRKETTINFFPLFSSPALFLLISAAVSMLAADFPNLTVYELIEIVKMYLAFFYLANNIRTPKDLNIIITVLIISLALEGFLGICQRRYSDTFWPTALGGPHFIANDRVSGTWVSYNDFSWYLTYILPISLSMLFARKNLYYKAVCGFSIITGGASLMYTRGRSGWIAFAAAALFVTFLTFSKIRGRTNFLRVMISIMLVAILIAPIYPRMYNKIYSRFTADDGGAAQSRFPQFKIAWQIIKEHPLMGIGLNNYIKIMWDYEWMIDDEEGQAGITLHPVHNIFLQIGAEMGLLGLAVFIWLTLVIFFEGIKHIVYDDSNIIYPVIGMLGGIVAFLIHGLFDTASLGSKLYMFLWFFSGIIFGINKMDTDASV